MHGEVAQGTVCQVPVNLAGESGCQAWSPVNPYWDGDSPGRSPISPHKNVYQSIGLESENEFMQQLLNAWSGLLNHIF